MMRKIFGIAATLILASLTGFGQSYTQNFNTLINSGTGTYNYFPDGWGIYEIGTATRNNGMYSVTDGSTNTGDAYSFGVTGSSERALGSIASGTARTSVGVIFFNETENPITSVSFSYVGEQWRFGGGNTSTTPQTPRTTQDSLKFTYSLDAAGLKDSTWTWVTIPSANFKSPYYNSIAAVKLVGDDPANRQLINVVINNIQILPGQSIILRWTDYDIAGNDDGLAVDDFTLFTTGLTVGVMSSGGQVTGGSGTAGGNTGGTINATNITPFINTTSNDSSYVYLYGNLHSHSSYSDGNQDDKTKTPSDDYAYALNSPGFDFLGISEHNHSTAGLNISNYKLGYQQAEAANGQTNSAGNPFITLYGMEWGVISGGGHVVTYGFGDQLVGWEMGNYDIYVAKSDYASLFKLVTQTPGTFCTLAHPQSGDYSNLASVYNSTGDSAVVGVALESGPATGTQAASPTYPTSLSYLSVYRQMLSNGYRVGADFDQDNHNMTFGTINNNRTVVLARSRTREGVMDAYRNMRFYGSNDYNAKVNFTAGTYTMGSSIVSADQQTLTVTHSDPDGENAVAIQLWGGKVGDPVPTSPLATSATNSLTFTTNQTGNMTWYYYAVVTQADGNKMITSPIWLTSYVPYTLPVNFVSFYGNAGINQNVLNWETATETNSSKFLVERSGGNAQMSVIGTVEAAGNSTGHKKYAFVDASPLQGQNLYRLKEVDQNGKVTYTPFVRIFSNQIQLVNVYPNPASNELMVRISAPAQEMKSVSLVDAAGNMVYKADQTTSMFRIDTSKFPKGTYVLSVQSPTVKSAQKVVLK